MATQFKTVVLSGRDKVFVELHKLLPNGRVGVFNIVLEDGTSVVRPKISSFESSLIRGHVETPWRFYDNWSVRVDKSITGVDVEKEYDAKNIKFIVEEPLAYNPWMLTLMQVGEIHYENKGSVEYDPGQIPVSGLIFRYYKTWTHSNAGKSFRVKKIELLKIEAEFDLLAEEKACVVRAKEKSDFEKIKLVNMCDSFGYSYTTLDTFIFHTHDQLMKIFVKHNVKQEDYKEMMESQLDYIKLHSLLGSIFNKYTHTPFNESNKDDFIMEWLRLIKKYLSSKLQLQYLTRDEKT